MQQFCQNIKTDKMAGKRILAHSRKNSYFCNSNLNIERMKQLNILTILFILIFSTTFAQANETIVDKKSDTTKIAKNKAKIPDSLKVWKFDGLIGLDAGATGLVSWTAGGQNNASVLTFVKLHLLYDKNNMAWETNFDSDYGMTWIDQDDDQLKKTSDNIKFSTKYGWEFKKNLYLTVLGSFQSQYDIGRKYKKGQYDPVISKWLCPSYTELSLGIDWKTTVNGCNFSVYVSPLATYIATAYVNDATNEKYTKEYLEAMAEAGEPVKSDYVDFRREMQIKYSTYKIIKDQNGVPVIDWRDYRVEFGLSFKGTINYKYKNLVLSSTLYLFTPYRGKGFDLKEAYESTHPGETWNQYYRYSNLNRQFGYFDVDWDFLISYQFLKVLNVTLSTRLKYYNGTLIEDKNGVVKDRVQFKSVIGLGLGYSF